MLANCSAAETISTLAYILSENAPDVAEKIGSLVPNSRISEGNASDNETKAVGPSSIKNTYRTDTLVKGAMTYNKSGALTAMNIHVKACKNFSLVSVSFALSMPPAVKR